MLIEEIEHLLDYTRTLQLYETKLSKATGEYFNVFQILRIGSREVTTHSPMLAELLNPQGRHGMGSRFLEIFTEQILKQFDLRLDSTARVETEYWAGTKSEDSGGRIDILITDNNNTVIIENKIYASDQEKQISRYLKSRPYAKILYLTLDGHLPSEEIAIEAKKRFRCISYRTDIIHWLGDCQREATHSPLVRETIVQYINLIKVLTGQNTNSFMQEQITESILKNPGTLDAYLKLVRSQEDVIKKLLTKLKKQCEEIGKELNLDVDFDVDQLNNRYGGFFFFDEEMKKRNIWIGFQFQGRDFRDLVFGIVHVEEEKNTARSPIADRFEKIFGPCEPNSWWPAGTDWIGREDWRSENDNSFHEILSGKLKNELRDKVQKLSGILRDQKC